MSDMVHTCERTGAGVVDGVWTTFGECPACYADGAASRDAEVAQYVGALKMVRQCIRNSRVAPNVLDTIDWVANRALANVPERVKLVMAVVEAHDQQLAGRLMALEQALRGVKLRMVRDHYTDTTGSDEFRRWVCYICEWGWRHGDAELHEPSCPLQALIATKQHFIPITKRAAKRWLASIQVPS